MTRLLLAIDESKFSQAALQLILGQFRPEGTQVRVLHVMESIEIVFPLMATEFSSGYYPPEPVDLDKVRKERANQAQKLVASAAGTLRNAGFQVDTAVSEGDARAEIIDMAARWKADLIVIGSHGRKALDRFLLGSVSEFVARHATCSVEIVRLAASPGAN